VKQIIDHRFVTSYIAIKGVLMDIGQILRDNAWTFAAFVVSVIAIIVAIGIYLKQRGTKQLAYSKSITRLLSMNEEIENEGQVQILVHGEVARNVSLVRCRIVNTGSIPIRREDYDSPLALYLGPEARIYSAEVIDASSDLLKQKVVAHATGPNVAISNILLNRKEWYLLKVLAADVTKPYLTGHIAGVNKLVSEDWADQNIRPKWTKLLYLIGTNGALLIALSLDSEKAVGFFVWFMVGMSLGIVHDVWESARPRKYPRIE
jgi:hypothetical protein